MVLVGGWSMRSGAGGVDCSPAGGSLHNVETQSHSSDEDCSLFPEIRRRWYKHVFFVIYIRGFPMSKMSQRSK